MRVKPWLIGMLIVCVVMTGGTIGLAAVTMKVAVNGKEVAFKTAPTFQNNVLMVPLEEVVSVLGIEAKWNVGTNTLEVTDTRAEQLTKFQRELEQAQKDLAALKAAGSAPSAPVPAVTKETLLSELQKQFPSVTVGTHTMNVRWYTFTSTDGEQFYSAETNSLGRLAFLGMRVDRTENQLKQWFEKAAALIATVHPRGAVGVLVARDVYSSYPTARWDSVRLGDDFKWHLTDYILWYGSDRGVFWDTDN